MFNVTLVVVHKRKPEATAVICVLVFNVFYSIACSLSSTAIHRMYVIIPLPLLSAASSTGLWVSHLLLQPSSCELLPSESSHSKQIY